MALVTKTTWLARWMLVVMTVGGLGVWACNKPAQKPDRSAEGSAEGEVEAPPPATLEDVRPVESDEPSVMEMALSEGRPERGEGVETPVAETEALSKSEVQGLLARLSPLRPKGSGKEAFAKREGSRPAPRTGEVVKTSFPPESERARPDGAAEGAAGGPLKLLRVAPEGEVKLVPRVSVTFNQPMVEVGSHDESVADGVPVEISPQPPGSWRWVGTRTVLFEPEAERFPMATRFEVRVSPQAESASGETLGAEKSWSFTTPTLSLEQARPRGAGAKRQPVVVMGFNQRIDRQKLLDSIALEAGGETWTADSTPGRESDDKTGSEQADSEQADNEQADNEQAESESAAIEPVFELLDRQQVEEALSGPGPLRAYDEEQSDRWLAFRVNEQLPYNSDVRVVLRRGARSAEGPRRTQNDLSFQFRTYGPFEVRRSRCGYRECRPRDGFTFNFTNPMDGEAFEESMVEVEPSYPGMKIRHGHWGLAVSGRMPGRRTYTVTLSEKMKDRYGQTLQGKRRFEFEVGAARPAMFSTGGNFMVLDPAAEATFSVFTVNYADLKVKAYRVEPEDYGAYTSWRSGYGRRGRDEESQGVPGEKVVDTTVQVKGAPDRMVETKIDLRKALGKDGLGNVVLVVDSGTVMKGAVKPRYTSRIRTWVQSTTMALDGFVDDGEFLGWATSLKDGEPLSGVKLTLAASGKSGTTDETGLATIELPASREELEGFEFLKGERDGEVAFLPQTSSFGYWGYRRGRKSNSRWYRRDKQDRLRWFVFDDREMYRPGETVHVKGWMRVVETAENGDVRLASGEQPIAWTVYGPRRNKLASGETTTTGLGGFDLKFKLSETPNLGRARLHIRATDAEMSGKTYRHYFQIQEFRRPKFEVGASAGEGPHFAGGSAEATVSAKYYAGGPLPGAEVSWRVRRSQSHFTPPNQHGFSFGTVIPWWIRGAHAKKSETATHQGKTGAAGEHHLKLDFGDVTPPRPMTVQAEATVQDVDRQSWTARTNLLVHPSRHYVGLRTERYFVERGEPLEVEAIVADIDGERLGGRPVKLRAARVEWTWKDGRYRQTLVNPQDCALTTAEVKEAAGEETEPATCTFETKVGGRYKIRATTSDDWGRHNFTEISRWVSGGKRPTARKVEREEVELIPDRDEYLPGESAEILIQSPIVPAEALVTLRRDGIVWQKRVTMAEATKTVEIPIRNVHVPNVRVQVDVVGNQPRVGEDGEPDEALPTRPAYASGQINLSVPPVQRKLAVEVEADDEEVEPGATTGVTVRVRDADGEAVGGAEVAVVVVDEAILSLSDYEMADPMSVFYYLRSEGVDDYYFREHVTLADPENLKQAQRRRQPSPEPDMADEALGGLGTAGRGGGGGGYAGSAGLGAASKGARRMRRLEEAPAPTLEGAAGVASGSGGKKAIAVRSDFNPLAAFAPAVITDAEGRAEVSVEMPDNLTRYRVMAVAVHGGQKFGGGEDAVTARLPLMVRPSAPRFLNFGDAIEMPVTLHNQTDEPLRVNVAARARNLKLGGSEGYSLEVPANNRVEVRFPATTDSAGKAQVQLAASSEAGADAARVEFPVWTPATSEAFATYGTIDKGTRVLPIEKPGEVWDQFGGLEVTTSSTALQALTDAFLYLYAYPYECSEQISSRMLSAAALRDVLEAFDAAGMPSDAELARSMRADIEELTSRQDRRGGFGLWRRGQRAWPFVTIHATHALLVAKEKGFDVSARVLQRSRSYLRNVERYIPGYYPTWVRRVVVAYSLYLRDKMGDTDVAKARQLIRRAGGVDKLPFETVGWLLEVLSGQKAAGAEVAELRRFINNRVTETAGAAHFAARYSEQDYLIMHSDRRADAVILKALMEDQPKSDLIAKVVRGLLAHRERGRWGNTQENAWVLLALDRYFRQYEKQTPDFVARLWLGERYAGEHAFEGRTTERHHVDVPMAYLAEQAGGAGKSAGESKLYLQKDGKGRMYYRVGMTYAPKSLELEPSDHGFAVERRYEAVDDPEDVRRREDGTWVVRAGTTVKVTLTMVAPTRRYHVALVDPMPGGFESLNPALATTRRLPRTQNRRGSGYWWWYGPWYEHQNLRDERAEAFASLVRGGVYTYTYFARATTPGEFVVPPAKAEEMYHPETFGRSGTAKLVVRAD